MREVQVSEESRPLETKSLMWSELDPRVTEKIFIREPRKQKETRNTERWRA
jgi:hypothetical protein